MWLLQKSLANYFEIKLKATLLFKMNVVNANNKSTWINRNVSH